MKTRYSVSQHSQYDTSFKKRHKRHPRISTIQEKNRYRSYSSYAKCTTITPGLVGHLGLSMELSFISNHAELVSTLNRRAKLFTLHSKHVLLRV